MRVRIVLRSLLVVCLLALAGCGAAPGESPSATTATAIETATPTVATTTATTESTREPTTTTESGTTEPQYGDNLLYTTAVNTSVAMQVNASKRATFSELTPAQQDVFKQTYNCSCYAIQEVFLFNDEDRIAYVNYEGQWYFLRVAIV